MSSLDESEIAWEEASVMSDLNLQSLEVQMNQYSNE
jgi:hypothetical protein